MGLIGIRRTGSSQKRPPLMSGIGGGISVLTSPAGHIGCQQGRPGDDLWHGMKNWRASKHCYCLFMAWHGMALPLLLLWPSIATCLWRHRARQASPLESQTSAMWGAPRAHLQPLSGASGASRSAALIARYPVSSRAFHKLSTLTNAKGLDELRLAPGAGTATGASQARPPGRLPCRAWRPC